jgi:hypothetical protein
MARRYYRRSYRSRDKISHEYARQHIEDYYRLVRELGGSVEDVKQYLFSLPPQKLREIFDAYEAKHGTQKRNYLQSTIEQWRTGKRRMSGTVAERLFALLPSRMPPAIKYQLIENLWDHVGPKSKRTLRVGLDANLEQTLDAIRSHIEEVVTHFRIPEELERRFNWLAAGASHAKQDLLNYLRSKEKTLVIEGARIQLPVLLDHLRGDAGQYTHRVAQVLKMGNHELELLIDKNASGVAVVEPYAARPSSVVSQPTNFKWLWWAAAAIVILYLFAHLPTQHSSHQSSVPAPMPSHQPSVTGLPQSNTRTSDLIKPATPALSSEPNSFSDHGPGRVACDGQWSTLRRNDSGYRDFMVNCMKNRIQ